MDSLDLCLSDWLWNSLLSQFSSSFCGSVVLGQLKWPLPSLSALGILTQRGIFLLPFPPWQCVSKQSRRNVLEGECLALNKERNKKTPQIPSRFCLCFPAPGCRMGEPSFSSSLGAELLECDGKLMCELFQQPVYSKTRIFWLLH